MQLSSIWSREQSPCFNADVDKLASFHQSYTIDIGNIVQTITGLEVSNPNLGKPIRIGVVGSGLSIMASADPTGAMRQRPSAGGKNSSSNFLVSLEVFDNESCVRSILPVKSNITCLATVAPHTFLAASGNCKTAVYQYIPNSNDGINSPPYIKPGCSRWHSQVTTDLAASPLDPSKVISCSADRDVLIVDVSQGMERANNTLQHCQLNLRYAHAARWCTSNPFSAILASNCIGNQNLALNNSLVEIHDLRSVLNPAKPTIHYSCNRPMITAVCPLENHLSLIGFNDGEIRLIDQRNPRTHVSSVIDPYVSFISDIQYNPRSQSFIVSGLQDFSVWKVSDFFQGQLGPGFSKFVTGGPNQLKPMDGEFAYEPGSITSNTFSASIWSHSHSSKNRADTNSRIAYFAQFWNDDNIIVTDTKGRAHMYKQAFDRFNHLHEQTSIPIYQTRV